MTTKKKLRKPTSVQIERLQNGNIRVEWNAPIKVTTMDAMVSGYRKCNKFIADADGFVVGFELHPDEYNDMVGKRLGVLAEDVTAEMIVKESRGR